MPTTYFRALDASGNPIRRRFTYSGSWSGAVAYWTPSGDAAPPEYTTQDDRHYYYPLDLSGNTGCDVCGVSFGANGPNSWLVSLGMQAAFNGIGALSQNISTAVPVVTTGTFDISGSWSAYIDVELWVGVNLVGTFSGTGAGFPTGAGGSTDYIIDPPAPRLGGYAWRAQPGGTAYCTMTTQGQTVSITETIANPADQGHPPPEIKRQTYHSGQIINFYQGPPGALSFSESCDGHVLTPYDGSDSLLVLDAYGGHSRFGSIYVDANTDSPPGTYDVLVPHRATVNVTVQQYKTINLEVNIAIASGTRLIPLPGGPNTVGLNRILDTTPVTNIPIDVANGEWSSTYYIDNYSLAAECGSFYTVGSAGVGQINMFAYSGVKDFVRSLAVPSAVHLNLRSASDPSGQPWAALDPRHTRVNVLGKQFKSFTIQQANDYITDSCTSTATWSVVSGSGTIGYGSPSGIAVQSTAGAVFDYGQPGVNTIHIASYRYLRIYCYASTANQTMTFNIFVTATGTWVPFSVTLPTAPGSYVDIDLMAPLGYMATTHDTSDTAYPLNFSAPVQGPYWGIDRFGHAHFQIPDGVTVTFTQFGLHRSTFTHANFAQAFERWIDYGYDSSNDCLSPAALGVTDGRQSLEYYGGTRPHGGTGGQFTEASIGNFMAWVNQTDGSNGPFNPGWSAVDASVAPSGCSGAIQPEQYCLLNNALPVTMIMANGWAFLNPTGAGYNWTSGYDLACDASPATVWGQFLWDELDVPSDGGDVMLYADGSNAGATTIKASVVIDGVMHGDVLSPADPAVPLNNEQVILQRVNYADCGTGISGLVVGFYVTMFPGCPGANTATSFPVDLPPGINTYVRERKRNRIVWRAGTLAPSPRNPWIAEDRLGMVHAVWITTGTVGGTPPKSVAYSRSPRVLPPFEVSVQPQTGDVHFPRVAVDSRDRVIVLYQLSVDDPVHGTTASVWEVTSDDDAGSFTSTPIERWAAGNRPAVATSDTGILRACVSGGQIVGLWQDHPSATPSALTFMSGGAALVPSAPTSPGVPTTLGLCYEPISERWLLHLVISGETASSLWTSADDGATWTRSAGGITGGVYPTVAVGDDGTVLLGACVPLASPNQASATLWLQQWHAGAAGAAWTPLSGGAAIVIDTDSFQLGQGREAGCRWALVASQGGIVVWWSSADEGQTWSAV